MVVATQDVGYKAFPTMVTQQSNYVCDLVFPCFDQTLGHMAASVAIDAVKAVNGVGLFGVEMFLKDDGWVSVNEIAPRPHNTGHYSLDWGGTSQFEAHIQVCLGCFEDVCFGQPTCMANILGVESAGDVGQAYDSLSRAHPESRFHWYGKRQSKPGRKMGHLNVVGTWAGYGEKAWESGIIVQAKAARAHFYEAWSAK